MTAVEEHVELWNTRHCKRGFIISTFLLLACVSAKSISTPCPCFTLLNLLAATVRSGPSLFIIHFLMFIKNQFKQILLVGYIIIATNIIIAVPYLPIRLFTISFYNVH